MPLINGQKMACEPCIRGHRSTKCTHANERLMVPVRKPGRPLSSCPHPSSRPCSCATVTAAIPRKQKCGCGTSPQATPEIKSEVDDSSAEATPISPTRANSNYRVRKPTQKTAASRKQSIDAVGLQRMDASQLNILPTYDAAQPKTAPVSGEASPSIQGMPIYNPYSMTPTTSTFTNPPIMFTAFPQQIPATISEPESPSLSASKAIPTTTNGTTEMATGGGCCGGKKAPANDAPAPPPPPTTTSSCCGGSVEKKPTPKSCCSSKSVSQGTSNGVPHGASNGVSHGASNGVSHGASNGVSHGASNGIPNGTTNGHSAVPEAMPIPDMSAQPNGMMMSPFASPVILPNGMYHYFPQPTIFTYPPQYGSYMQPLLPEQWRQFMSTMNYGQPPHPSAVDMRATMPLPVFGTPETSAGTTHQCTCGDGCQCVGCASHPYNEATQNYVRSAWNSMAEDGQNGHKPFINGNGDASREVSGHGSSNGVDPAFKSQGDGTISPPAPQTPSDVASNDEQTLSASDFFFVTYPFGDSCAGETASCPCGDDCQCIGCVIHNNPGPLLSADQEAL